VRPQAQDRSSRHQHGRRGFALYREGVQPQQKDADRQGASAVSGEERGLFQRFHCSFSQDPLAHLPASANADIYYPRRNGVGVSHHLKRCKISKTKVIVSIVLLVAALALYAGMLGVVVETREGVSHLAETVKKLAKAVEKLNLTSAEGDSDY